MYNAEQKTRFIKAYTDKESLEVFCVKTFNAVGEFEEKWGADICTKSADELGEALNSIVGLRDLQKNMRFRILRQYAKWCLENDIPGACDGILNVEIDGMDKMRQQTVRNPKHLQRYLDIICEPEEDHSTDEIVRCFFWLAYSGMGEEDILLVTAENVDFQSMVIKFDGREYPIYREAIPVIRACMTLTQFQYKNPTHPDIPKTLKDRVPGNTLMRGVRGTPSVKSMRVKVSKLTSSAANPQKDKDGKIRPPKTSLKLTYYSTWLSGVFYRVYEGELAGADDTYSAFYTAVQESKKDVVYNLRSGRNTQSAKYRKLATDFQKDYERWKATFVN